MKFDFLILGNDKRFSYVANYLALKNFNVLVLDSYGEKLNKTIKKTNSLNFAIKNSKNIICSIPFTRDFVFMLTKNKNITINRFLSLLTEENLVFGGCFTEKFLKICKEKNVFVYDYYKNEKFIVYNSIATAEAAIATAILKNPVNMHSSSSLVLGFGNCGKIIANKLKNLSKKVFVCTNNKLERAWAKAYGFSVFSLDSLIFKIEKFKFIFNTIPKNIFSNDILDYLDEDAFVLDITASGIDSKKIKNKNLKFEQILGIPGKFKASSSAKIIEDLTLKTIKKLKYEY